MTRFESFRDPAGKVILTNGEVWRLVKNSEAHQLREFLALDVARTWSRERSIVDTEPASAEEISHVSAQLNGSAPAEHTLFKHRRVEFPSFAYEWSPAMLHDAGTLTLQKCEQLMELGWGMKDATPFNILFDGSNPVFVDLLSFEKRDPLDAIWLPYNQFVQTFLIPLLVSKERRVPLRKIFISDRDGMSPSEAASLFGKLGSLKPRVFSLVTLPELLSGRARKTGELYKPKNAQSAEVAQFVLRQTFRRLRKHLRRAAPENSRGSDWSGYTDSNRETIPDYMRAKEVFVTEGLEKIKPAAVLDVGCNTGFFSFMAARSGASVVAVDHDEAVIDRVFREAKQEGLNVLPLVVNLSRPTPRLGWRYSENPSFLDRANGRFDLVMMLAVVHHMLVQERIPLREIFRLASELTKDALIVEFVPPGDKMFRMLTRGRDHLHQDLTAESFLQTASEFFEIQQSQALPETERSIYLMRKK
jgi:2-polyprenyl-3-methyl-5-hydroxy-6-metoxy-1,4-benzoquinol methylase